jgi:hypothetical protein
MSWHQINLSATEDVSVDRFKKLFVFSRVQFYKKTSFYLKYGMES